MSELTDKLKVTRGKGYYTVLKAILGAIGPQIATDARAIVAENGEFSTYNIGCLALKYDLNFKATCEWLEESQVLPVGTYDRLKRSGLKFGKILLEIKEAARPAPGRVRCKECEERGCTLRQGSGCTR